MDEGTGTISKPLIGLVFQVTSQSVGEAAQQAADAVLAASGLPGSALYGVTVLSDAIPEERLPHDYPPLLD
jgi:hypothetical protein